MDSGGINELLTAAHLIESTASTHRIKSKNSNNCGGGCPTTTTNKRCVNSHSRTAHNELEKTRRANLRNCLDRLKDMVPTSGAGGSDSTSPRNTTLSLLTRARNYIQTLENTNQAIIAEKRRLQDQQRLMRRHLELLTAARVSAPSVIVRKRTTSESSTSTISANDANDMHSDESLDEHLQSSSSQQASGSSSPNGGTWMLEYSPSTKPTLTENIDPYIEGLLPTLPLFHPPLSVYPYFGVKCAHDSPTTFVLIGGHQLNQLSAFYPSTY